MQGFEDVTLSWKGEEYVVPAKRMLLLIAQLEDILRGRDGTPAVQNLLRPGGPGMADLAMGFGCALRYAGATVSDDEVFLAITSDLSAGKADVAAQIQGAIVTMVSIIAPPIGVALRDPAPETDSGAPPKKTVAPV